MIARHLGFNDSPDTIRIGVRTSVSTGDLMMCLRVGAECQKSVILTDGRTTC